ncbi:MAG: DUF4345 family protein [Rhizobiales bacterium]|nr:DUF4345 family protein [Hyphomicrobiales bacterium]NRB13643.1 DUF4345 family protein [Hyphomicrobiales bacterium]
MKNTKLMGKGIFVLVALFFIATGLMLMFNPSRALEGMLVGSVEPAAALSSIRALWGGAILAIGVNVLIGALTENFAAIRVGPLFVLALIFARIYSYFVDGSFDGFTASLIPPVIVFILMLIAHKLLANGIANK